MRIGSLFSGYGGLDAAVQSVVGGTVAWVSDIDPGPAKILAHHWPDVPNLRDITQVDFAGVEPVDVLTGGFPCQDVSHAGRRQGLIRDGDGRTRSGLWGEMLRAIDQLRPHLVVAENVRGLLSAQADSDVEPCPWCLGDPRHGGPMRALGAVLADLADIGYDAAWCGLRAADVGAAHGRFRVFITAWPATDPQHDGRHGTEVRRGTHPSQDVGRVQQPQGSPADPGLTLLSTPQARDYKGVPGDGFNTNCLARDVTLLPTPAVNDMGAGKTPEDWDAWTDRMKAAHGNGNGHGASLHIEALRLLPTPEAQLSGSTPEAHLARKPGRTEVTSLNVLTDHGMIRPDFGDYAPAIARWERVLGRSAPSPTEATGRDGAHRLSPRFVEWLMGLPEGHVTGVPGLTRNQQLKALGNGVVPQQAAAALTHLLAQEVAA